MDPIPETLAAINELDPYLDEHDLLEQLTTMAASVRGVVPDCVGISVASREDGVTFTLVATDDEIAALDGVQYLAGGPCVDGVAKDESIVTTRDDLLDEDRWRDFAQATAAAGIRSTLTLPIMRGDEAVGSVNLYGHSGDSFTGKRDELADILGGWAPGAVANADLSFSTRRAAEAAPDRLRDETRIEVAVGLLAARQGIDVDTARDRLEQAARRAGLNVVRLAEVVISMGGV